MKLRPHHLLCIQKFTGHGYSNEFTTHMDSLVKELSRNTEIRMVRGCDELCEKCPNNKCGKCTSFDKVDTMDDSVLDICGISYGESGAWATLSEKARMRIFNTSAFENICGSCQWFGLCKNTEVK